MPDAGNRADDDLSVSREGDVMAGDRRIARPDSALPDWYLSDAAYRPIPIAWFAGALILQVLVQPMIFALLFNYPAFFTIAVSLLVTGLVGHMTWKRGMAKASLGWRIATFLMLAVTFSLTALVGLSRI